MTLYEQSEGRVQKLSFLTTSGLNPRALGPNSPTGLRRPPRTTVGAVATEGGEEVSRAVILLPGGHITVS